MFTAMQIKQQGNGTFITQNKEKVCSIIDVSNYSEADVKKRQQKYGHQFVNAKFLTVSVFVPAML